MASGAGGTAEVPGFGLREALVDVLGRVFCPRASDLLATSVPLGPQLGLDGIDDGPGEVDVVFRRVPVDRNVFARIAVGHGMTREMPGGVEPRGEPESPGTAGSASCRSSPMLWVLANAI
jgi:hypothetical protein